MKSNCHVVDVLLRLIKRAMLITDVLPTHTRGNLHIPNENKCIDDGSLIPGLLL